MRRDKVVESVLKMHDLHFDSIEFKRIGVESDNPASVKFQVETSTETPGITGIRLSAIVDKEDDYHLDVKLVAAFSFENDSGLSAQMRKDILDNNTVAVMFPYLRSQVSLMTTQPGIEPIIIPPMNIADMFGESGPSEAEETE